VIGKNRVVITGLGVLAANGIGKDAFWKSLLAGESGIGPVTLCDVEGLPSQIAGEVSGFKPDAFLKGKVKAKRLTRNTQFATSAATLALEDAGINTEELNLTVPLSIVLGVSLQGFDFVEDGMARLFKKGKQFVLPAVLSSLHIISASMIAELLGLPCTINVISNSCVGGVDAIATAFAQIRDGQTETALAGGSDAPISTSLMAAFCSGKMLCTKNDNPKLASAPFDLRHERGVLAEGASMVVLESLEHALDRGARPYAEVLGYGSTRDSTAEPASGLEDSMRKAIDNAGLLPESIDFISAHGPSDLEIDRMETCMIKKVLGKHAYGIPVHSIKGAIGNPLAAGGALQVSSAALSLQQGTIPPTTNYKVEDPDCDLDYVAGKPRMGDFNYVLINSHGTGKINSSLILGKPC
jgi:3-oxoacyl-[acyl-carrier-protein] synthase II